jgi:hypothetical protein
MSLVLVFKDAAHEVAGDTDVECSAFAGNDIGEIGAFTHS